MIGGSLARSWPPPLPRYRRYCVLPLLLLLGLSAAAANNRCAVLVSAVLLCACSRTYGASWRELGERHASCDILFSLLLQLRLLQVLLRTAAAADAAAAAFCCCCLLSFFKVGLPEAANIHCSGSALAGPARTK